MNRERENEWGESINFDGKNCGPVREFFITNGRYWIEEFHFDGFRFDATQSIHDKSQEYIVAAIGRAARQAAGERAIILIAENETQEPKLVRSREEGGDDLDAVWNDDWHHSAMVALTGRNEAYYTDYTGSPQEFISAAKAEMQAGIGVPHDTRTFEESKLDWNERERNSALCHLHRDLLRLRREDSRLRLQIAGAVDGAVLSAESFLLRFLSEQNDDRLLIINFGRRQRLVPAPEPLLAPPSGCEWELLWSSESARYDGPGTVDIATDDEWILPAEAAFVLRPRLRTRPQKKPKKR